MAITADDAILNYLPLFHAFGLSEGSVDVAGRPAPARS